MCVEENVRVNNKEKREREKGKERSEREERWEDKKEEEEGKRRTERRGREGWIDSTFCLPAASPTNLDTRMSEQKM